MRRLGMLATVVSVACAGADTSTENTDSVESALCTKATLTASSVGPVTIGTPIELTANAASCGVGETPEYRFLIKRDGAASVFSELRPYGAAAQFQLDTSPLAPGKYLVQVYSRAIGRTASRDASASLNLLIGPTCNAVTLSATPGSPQLPGATIEVTGDATCSEGAPAEHRLQLRPPGGSYAYVSDWSSEPFQWATDGLAAGPYALLVHTRAVGNASTFEAQRSLSYRLGATCSQLQGTVLPAQAAPPGSAVALSAQATCTGGVPADYQFSFRPSTGGAWQVIAPWGPASASWATGTLTPGPYQILLSARASDYAGPAQVSKALSYNIGGVCSAVALTASPKSPQPLGTFLTLSATATCIGSPIEYRFLYRDSLASGFTEIAPFSQSAAVQFDTNGVLPGPQTLQVQARVQGNTAAQQVSKTAGYQLGDVCNSVTLAATPTSPQPSGTPVSVTAVAKCVSGGMPEYRFAYRPTGGTWLTFRDWGTGTASLLGLSLSEGSYSVLVEARGQGHPGTPESSRTLNYAFGPPCPPGYQGNGQNGCVDVDECATNHGGCDALTTCSNTPGAFECGPCPAGYTGAGAAGCQDIDECATNNGGCNALANCSNTEGGYSCSPCPPGYTGNGVSCQDIDECDSNHGGCDPLSECLNAPGSFACGPCPPGYSGDGATGCSDLDECATNNGGCHWLTTCSNAPGSFGCGPCPPGFTGSGTTSCDDIDECASGNGGCDPLTTCYNDPGGFACGLCPPGYTGSGDTSCQDIDECAVNHGGCDPLASCSNSPGAFACGPCPPGYGGSGATGCIPPNPCSPNPCQNGGSCSPDGASYTCTCSNGYGGASCEIAPATLLAAGDVGDCNTTTDTATGLLLGANTGTIAALGDLAYPNGTASNFSNCFTPVWGPHVARMKPVPGNHEYNTAGAAGYFGYFGALAGDPAKGYYSYDLGTWHVVALNSNCSNVSCSAGSAQETWLRQDLLAHPSTCTLTYWHHPRFSSGEHGNASNMSAIWKALVEGGVELALSGHDHDYERFAAQNDNGVVSASGVVQFVVGTGGTELRPIGTPLASSLARNDDDHGVLKLTLAAGAYSWNFLPVAGKSYTDSGTATCH